jgi:lipopolysaccharide transport system permease protein
MENKTKLTEYSFRRITELGNPRRILRNLYKQRFLLEQMTRRDVTQRYRGSFLGILWSIITPLLMLVIYTFVFSVVFQARWLPDQENLPMGEFALTLLAGLIPFNYFSEVLNRSTSIVVNHANYVKKVVFPLEILTVMISGTALINSLINLGIFILGSLIFLRSVPATILLLPLVYLPLILLCLGIGWFLAALGVYIRDVGLVVTVVTQVLFFVTPIFYPIGSVPERLQPLIMLNPLTAIVENFRRLSLWGVMPDWNSLIIWGIIGLVVAESGYIWFMGTKKGFADVI